MTYCHGNERSWRASSSFFGLIDIVRVRPQGKVTVSPTAPPIVCPSCSFVLSLTGRPMTGRRFLETEP